MINESANEVISYDMQTMLQHCLPVNDVTSRFKSNKQFAYLNLQLLATLNY